MAQAFYERDQIVGQAPVPGAPPPPGPRPGGPARVNVPALPTPTIVAAKPEAEGSEKLTPMTQAEAEAVGNLDPRRAWARSSRGGYKDVGPSAVAAQTDVLKNEEVKAAQQVNAGYYVRAARSHNLYGKGGKPLSLARALVINAMPPEAQATQLSPAERESFNYVAEFIRAKLRRESGAAIPPDEMATEFPVYFPMPNEGPEDAERKRGIREQVVEAMRVGSGKAGEEIKFVGGKQIGGEKILPSWGAPPTGPSGELTSRLQLPAEGQEGLATSQEGPAPLTGEALAEALKVQPGDEGGVADPDWPIGTVQSLGDYGQWKRTGANEITNTQTGEKQLYAGTVQGGGGPTAHEAAYQETQLTPEEQAKVDAQVANAGATGAAVMSGGDIVTSGLLPRAGAALDAFTQAMGGQGTFEDNYNRYLLMNREALEGMQSAHPYASAAGQLVGGMVLPVGRFTNPAQAAGLGAAYSAAHAAGSARNLEEAALTVPTAALVGAGGGYVGGKLGQSALARQERLLQERTAREAAAGALPDEPAPADVARALQEEGILGSGPLVDPSLRGRMAELETNLGGHKPIRESLDLTRKGIAVGAQAKGAGGAAQEPFVMGETITKAAKRDIAGLKAQASNPAGTGKYDLAAAQAGADEIPVDEAIAALDAQIANLSRNPGSNKGSLAFLKRQRSNFFTKATKDTPEQRIPKTVADIRNIRTSIGAELRRKGLKGSPAELVMDDVLAAAGRDIEKALGATKPGALKLYQEGDEIWAKMHTNRREFLDNLIGPKGAEFNGENVMGKVRSMMNSKGDARTFDRIMEIMTPEERADFGATLFNNIGRKSPEEPFSPAHFLTQTQDMGMPQLKRLFGDDAARSIQNLRVASHAFKSTSGALNVSRSGFVENFKDVIGGALSARGAVGAIIGGKVAGIPGAVAGAVAGEGIKAARGFYSARALMNPDVGRWAREAGKATTMGEIRKLIDKLPEIGAKDARIRGEVTALREYLLRTIDSNFVEPALEPEPAQ